MILAQFSDVVDLARGCTRSGKAGGHPLERHSDFNCFAEPEAPLRNPLHEVARKIVRRLAPDEPAATPAHFDYAEHLQALECRAHGAARHAHPPGEFGLVRQLLTSRQYAAVDEFSQLVLDELG